MATIPTYSMTGIQYPGYYQDRLQTILNTIYGIPGTPDLDPKDPNYVKPVKGLIETPMDIPAETVAPFSSGTQNILDIANQMAGGMGPDSLGIGSFQPYLDKASESLAAATGTYKPTEEALQGFMNPYQKNVTEQALKEYDRQAALEKKKVADAAIASGAFGGGREGVERAELGRNLADIKSKRIFEDLQKNYAQALAGSQSAFESGAARNLYAAPQYRSLGDFASQAPKRDINFLLGLGSLGEQKQQDILDANYRNMMAQMMEPYERMKFGIDALGSFKYPFQELSTGSYQYDPYSEAFGTGLGIINLFS